MPIQPIIDNIAKQLTFLSMNQQPAMDDITLLMLQYRECVRHLWNTYFWQDARETNDDVADYDLADRFDDACVSLFMGMVLYKLELDDVELKPSYWYPEPILDFFQIKLPQMSSYQASRILVNREQESGCWDLDVTEEELTGITVSFIQFFDFDHYGYRNWAYYKGQIQSSTIRPDLIGRQVLIPVDDAKVYFTGKPEQK